MTIRALGAVVAVVLAAGCTGGGGGGGAGGRPTPFDLVAQSVDGAPECDVFGWCDGDLLAGVAEDDGSGHCMTPEATPLASIAGGGCFHGAAAQRYLDQACHPEPRPSGASWTYTQNDGLLEASLREDGAPVWSIKCRTGNTWASEVIRDGRLDIYNDDGTLFSSIPLTP